MHFFNCIPQSFVLLWPLLGLNVEFMHTYSSCSEKGGVLKLSGWIRHQLELLRLCHLMGDASHARGLQDWYIAGVQDHESDGQEKRSLIIQVKVDLYQLLPQTQGPQQSFAVAHTSAVWLWFSSSHWGLAGWGLCSRL